MPPNPFSHLTFPTLLAATLAGGCRDTASPDLPTSESRDSAGIVIVDNARPADDSRLPWRIGPEPSVSIGEIDGAESQMLHQIGDALTLSDGRIVIANRGTDEVRVFDSTGEHVTTFGRTGEGPGEFLSLGGIGRWEADSISAWDGRSRAISIFDSHGTLGRTLALEADPRPLAPGSTLKNSRFLGAGALPRTGQGYHRQELAYEVRDGDGEQIVSLGVHSGMESFMDMSGGIVTMGMLPFTREEWEAEWGELVILATNDRYEIRAYDIATGNLARIVRRQHTNRSPTRTEVDDAIDDALTRTNLSGDQLEQTREGYKSMPIVESFPAYRSLMTDALDHLWVREATLPGMERPAPLWSVFDADGRILGFIETPSGLTIQEIGADYLLGTTTDDLGVESVQLWALERQDD